MKIIIDTDIGDDIDDAFALQLALNTPELEILGVTTAFRNAYKRGKIVAALLAANKRRDIPVYAGEDEALSGGICKLTYETEPMKDADGSVNVPQYREEFSSYEVKRGGVEFLLRAAAENPGEVTLVCLAPLTNVAAAYLKDGETFSKLKKIVMMGGQVNGDYAEWNFRCDAKAAKIVFESGIPIIMAGLDVTEKALIMPEDFERIRALGNPVSDIVAKWLEFFYIFHKSIGYEGAPMHDPCAVMALIHPEVFTMKPMHVEIETQGEYCRGCTVGDQLGLSGKAPNAQVILDVDRKAFADRLVESMKFYGEDAK